MHDPARASRGPSCQAGRWRWSSSRSSRSFGRPSARLFLISASAALPKRVPAKAALDEAEIVKLSPEAKHLTDAIKMVAYRGATALVRCLLPHYVRTEDDGRAVIARCC